eukprot:comp8250_c0_seq1/m.3673 comp8250_c0_seq1/g.3673  ORF comp8250_c0_seq1/g.3673 comp8250_c0_seq1/m.3673 type:complete len:178 (-) comp8250_c0_seq1:438-971(-)
MPPKMKERKSPWALAMSEKGDYAVSRADEKSLLLVGYNLQATSEEHKAGQTNKAQRLVQLREAKAWEIAQGPIKAIPMNLFMMWMMGGSIQIFTMIMLVMMFATPIKGLGAVQQTFAPLGTEQSFNMQKVVFVILNLVSLGVPLYKAHSLGLMPTAADWLFHEQHDPRLELAVGGPI